jgi:alkanesulfonate monooxygenase
MSISTSAKPRIFATFPPSNTTTRDYLSAIGRVARWSEAGGCTGALIYTDNGLVDPWMVAHEVIRQTEGLCPLVAVQPVYMHPFWVAKMVATLAHLYQRRIYLNMVAGGFVNDLVALDDHTDHDARYDRLVEYTRIVQALLAGTDPVTMRGDWYQVKNLILRPAVEADIRPGYMVSGSSPAGMRAAQALGATAVEYPRPASDYDPAPDPAGGSDRGIRIGILAREDRVEAWRIALERFPEDPRGRMTHRLAMAVSDSSWHRQLSRLGKDATEGLSPYWLHPFENYKTFCPYLVGSYDDVAKVLAQYLEAGFRTFIMDVPREPDDLMHARTAFELADRLLAVP